jgi:hypothetical protein
MYVGKTPVTFFISILVTRNLRKYRRINKEIQGLYWHITLIFNTQLLAPLQVGILMRNREMVPVTGIIIVLIVSFVLVPGYISRQPVHTSSQFTPVKITFPMTVPVTGPGEQGNPDIKNTSNSSVNNTNDTSLHPVGLIVHSAAKYRTLPGWNNLEGTCIAVINISITNYKPTILWLPRDNLVIKTNLPGSTLEHGGDRVSPEIARNFLRFPLTIGPGETKTGSIVYIVNSGQPVNNLVLTDKDNVIQVMVDLNDYYNHS